MSEQNPADQNGKPPEEQASFDVSSEVKKLQEQTEKYKNDYLYLRAEFENYKRNSIKERSDAIKYGAERIVNDILGVADNFERAFFANKGALTINGGAGSEGGSRWR